MSNEESKIDWAALEAGFDQSAPDSQDPVPTANVHVYTSDIMAKHMLWNVVPCKMAEGVTKGLGLNWASPDVEDMEHRQAHVRLDGVEDVVTLTEALAVHGVRAALMATMIANEVPEDVKEGVLQESLNKIAPLVAQTTYGVIAELADMGMLHVPYVIEGEE